MSSTSENIKTAFFDSLIEGNRKECSKLIKEQIGEGQSIINLYETVIKPAMYRVGEMWEYNKISVATEHLASAIVEALLNELYPDLISKGKQEKKVIISCVEKEYHQIGIKMVGDVFENNGWNSYFLGANTPTKDLITLAGEIKADLLALSLSIYFHLPILIRMIEQIRTEFPKLPILVGGQAFTRGGEEFIIQYPNVTLLNDLFEIDSYIKTFN